MYSQKNADDLSADWRPIPGYEGLYEINSLGGVRTLKRTGEYLARWGMAKMVFPARMMKASVTPAGYHYLALKLPGKPSKKFLLHRLVMAAFVGPPPYKQQVNHKDGVKANNALSNLEYCTSSENLRHCIDVLGKKRGEGTGVAKIKESDVLNIRNDKRFLKEIAADYGVTLQAIWMVKKKKNWSHVE